MGLKICAFLWGLAEATLFFIVPDVLLSIVALRDRTEAVKLCFWALGGALIGGLVMYGWGRHDPDQLTGLLVWLPAISEAMVSGVAMDLQQMGAVAMFLGPLTGTPYKLYAAQAYQAELSLIIFMAISIPARLIRFLLVALFTSWVARCFLPIWSEKARFQLLVSVWSVFYTGYFLLMP